MDGNKLGKNPLKDQRVRLAISKAINREAIASRVMQGLSIPAAQSLPDGFFGSSEKLAPETYDPNLENLVAQVSVSERTVYGSGKHRILLFDIHSSLRSQLEPVARSLKTLELIG